jgi:hypothetical protein
MSLRRVLARNPVLVYVLAGYLVRLLGGLVGAHYDDEGFRGALYGVALILGAVSWAVSEAMFDLNGGKAFPLMPLMEVLLSVALAMLVDGALRKWRSKAIARATKSTGAPTGVGSRKDDSGRE